MHCEWSYSEEKQGLFLELQIQPKILVKYQLHIQKILQNK